MSGLTKELKRFENGRVWRESKVEMRFKLIKCVIY
jgi:hypothetical protein